MGSTALIQGSGVAFFRKRDELFTLKSGNFCINLKAIKILNKNHAP
jgi:hypothetical protein